MCAVLVVHPGAVFADATETSAVAPTSTIEPTPTRLVVGDGRTITLLGMGSTTANLVSRIAAEVGDAVEAVVAFWGADWQREIVVVAADSDAQFRALTGGPGQRVDIAGAAVADSVDPVRRRATGQRIVFAPGAAEMSPQALRIVLRHELFHFASRGDTALDAPRWLTEGVADFVARPDTTGPGPGSATEPAQLPTDADLDATGPVQSLAYDRAWWFSRFVAENYGTTALRALYLRACGSGHPQASVAVTDVLGADEPGVLAHWQRWLAGRRS